MADISATMVKELRDRTGAGMMEAKKALVAADGDIDAAIQALRESGAIKAEKKSGRATNEGRIGGFTHGDVAAVVEVLCETDFVAKNDQFIAFAEKVAESVAKAPAADDISTVAFVDGGSLADALQEQVRTIGENLQLGNFCRLEGAGCFHGLYIHNNGKIGVITQIKGEQTEAGADVAKDVAMHAAFTQPLGLNRDAVPSEIVEKEREVYTNQIKNEGKPENIIPKIVDGKINAFYKDRVLLEQPFVKDPKQSVTDVVKAAGDYELTGYGLIQIGGE